METPAQKNANKIFNDEKGTVTTHNIKKDIKVTNKLIGVVSIPCKILFLEYDNIRKYEATFFYSDVSLNHTAEFRTLRDATDHMKHLEKALMLFKDTTPVKTLKFFLLQAHTAWNAIWTETNGEIGTNGAGGDTASVDYVVDLKIAQHLRNFDHMEYILKSIIEGIGGYSVKSVPRGGFIRYEISSSLYKKIYAYIMLEKYNDGSTDLKFSFQTTENDDKHTNALEIPVTNEEKMIMYKKIFPELLRDRNFFSFGEKAMWHIKGTYLRYPRTILSILEYQPKHDPNNYEIFQVDGVYYCAKYSTILLHTESQDESISLISDLIKNLIIDTAEMNENHMKVIQTLVETRNRVYTLLEREAKSMFAENIKIDSNTTIHRERGVGEKAKGIHAISRFLYGEDAFPRDMGRGPREGEDPAEISITFIQIHKKPRFSKISWSLKGVDEWKIVIDIFPVNHPIEQEWLENYSPGFSLNDS